MSELLNIIYVVRENRDGTKRESGRVQARSYHALFLLAKTIPVVKQRMQMAH